MNIFVFDIETVPDVEAGRKIYQLDDTDDNNIANIMFHRQRQQAGNELLKLHLHKIVAISVVLRTTDKFRIWSLGNDDSNEKEILERFFTGIDKYVPRLVSWNGNDFDLPVLHYRALKHGINCQRYWEQGEKDTNFKSNNYINRFHNRHTDLMDVIAGYEPDAYAPLDEVASLLGLPKKEAMSLSKIWNIYQKSDIRNIRNNCETGVLNIYLVYLRFRLTTGELLEQEYLQEIDFVRKILQKDNKTHLNDFLSVWNN